MKKLEMINMEMHKTIDITFEDAKAWFNSDNETLKELALKVFSEDELNPSPYSEIKTFEDACNALYMSLPLVDRTIREISKTSRAMVAMYKLNIVRKALNLGHDLHLTKDPEGTYIYYPYNPFVAKDSTYYKKELNSCELEIIGKIKNEGEEYNVLNGCSEYAGLFGLGDFDPDDCVGYAYADFSLLGCASKEIADHFGKIFWYVK